MGNARRFHPDFALDLRNAVERFDGVSERIGERFRVDVRERIELVTSSPELFAPIQGDIRASRLKHFPFVLLYKQAPACVYIIALLYASSDQSNWFERV